jgi:CheY-like chemotaxis protein
VGRILVAEDEECVRNATSTFLARAGFGVGAASDGLQAWEALQQEHYDLLVTDNEMPRLTGLELIERIRGAGMSLPIIVASGSCWIKELLVDERLDIVAFIRKPFDSAELLTLVRIALQSPGETAATNHAGLPPTSCRPATNPLK